METRLSDGQKIRALLASQTSVRGPHIPRLRIDEAASMTLKLFDAAMGQTMAQGGVLPQILISFTWPEPNGVFTEVLRRAADRGWPVYSCCWRESLQPHGWLTHAQMNTKRNKGTQVMWDTEYKLGKPSESRAIMPEAVRYMFQRERGEYDGKPREYIEHEPPEPGALYAHDADWSKSQDWTEIFTLRVNVTPARLVAYERMQRLPWPQMVKRLDDRIERYGIDQSSTAHDGTRLGDVVNGYLTYPVEKVILSGRPRSAILRNGLGMPVAVWPIPPNWIMATPHQSIASSRSVFGASRGRFPKPRSCEPHSRIP